MQVSLTWRGSEGQFVKRGPTTSSRRFGLFRLVNVDRLFRKSKSAAHDHGPKSFDAHIGALNVGLLLLIFHSH